MHRGWRVLIVGLLAAGSACAHRRGAVTDTGGPQPAERPVRVHVINHYKEGMEVSATGAGIVQRLGLVSPGIDRDFVLPQALVGSGSVTFVAQPSGFGPKVQSEEVRIRPGAVVDFEIMTNLIGSRATVRL
jgi:hypothetical protein